MLRKNCCESQLRPRSQITLTTKKQDPIDTNIFPQGPYDTFRFTSSLAPTTGDIASTSAVMPVGSVDSGLGTEGMDYLQHGDGNGYSHERRSSSEEKDTLTPAQSR